MCVLVPWQEEYAHCNESLCSEVSPRIGRKYMAAGTVTLLSAHVCSQCFQFLTSRCLCNFLVWPSVPTTHVKVTKYPFLTKSSSPSFSSCVTFQQHSAQLFHPISWDSFSLDFQGLCSPKSLASPQSTYQSVFPLNFMSTLVLSPSLSSVSCPYYLPKCTHPIPKF